MKHHRAGSAIIRIAIIWIVIFGCKPEVQKTPVGNRIIYIKARPVEYAEFKIPVKATGLLTATTQAKLSFKTGGIIKQLTTREGESVQKDEVLAVLDLSEIKANVNQAQIGYEKAKRDLGRAENLHRDSVATLEQLQNARSAFELSVAQKQIAEFNLLHSRIKAPSDGQIQKVLVESNEMIAPGYPALLFASDESDWVVRCALTDKDIVKLTMGDSANVAMDAFPGNLFKAEITELGSVADPVTGTYEVELLILRPLTQFRTGFFSRVEIYPSEIRRSLVVPIEALLEASDKSAVIFLYKNRKVVKRRITSGTILDDRVEIVEGLKEGELVITEGAKYVSESSEVRLVNETDTPTP